MKSHGFQVGGERGHVGVSSTSAIWELASGLRSSGPGRWEETVPERVSYLPSVTRRFGSLGTTTVAPCFPTPCSVPTCIHGDSEGAAHGLPLQGPAHFSYVLTFPWGFLAQRDASPCPPPPQSGLSLLLPGQVPLLRTPGPFHWLLPPPAMLPSDLCVAGAGAPPPRACPAWRRPPLPSRGCRPRVPRVGVLYSARLSWKRLLACFVSCPCSSWPLIPVSRIIYLFCSLLCLRETGLGPVSA